jgi:hypothetical protein
LNTVVGIPGFAETPCEVFRAELPMLVVVVDNKRPDPGNKASEEN